MIRSGELDDALRAVQTELPAVSEEHQAQLAVEVFKAAAIRESLASIKSTLEAIRDAIEMQD